tara:strand:- start:206 stop:655 length:450 start_codon:yes stop_codon:yes gene_type:complete
MSIGKLVKGALRTAYKAKTAPLQAANRVARTIAPNTKIATALAAAASPKILASSAGKAGAGKVAQKGGTTERTPPSKPTVKKIKGKSAKGKGKVGKKRASDTSNFESLRPTMTTPGEAIAPKTRRMPARMKGGGLAIKGQGKAFLNSKR